MDWKQGTQDFDFGPPSSTPGSRAYAGLAVSRVTGMPTADEFWGHTDFSSHLGGGLNQLARGITLGSTGYADNTDYEFRFEFLASSLKVYVNNNLELNIAGSFQNGKMAFYNFSQANVTYSAFTIDPLPTPDAGSSLALLGGAFAMMGALGRRYRK